MSPPLNVLISFGSISPASFIKTMPLYGDNVRWLIDCGAFQAHTMGKVINLDDYCAFLRALPTPPWGYFSLDVIGDPVASERNYQIMLDRGFRPMPVFTRGEQLDHLERLYETTDVVAIGGLVSKLNAPTRYLKAVMQRIGSRRAHLLGFTTPSWLNYFRAYSCDSSSWSRAARFGHIDIYLGDGIFLPQHRHQLAERAPTEQAIRAIAGMGFDPYELLKWANWAGGKSLTRRISATSWIRYAIELERKVGTLLFLASVPGDHVTLAPSYRAVIDSLPCERTAA